MQIGLLGGMNAGDFLKVRQLDCMNVWQRLELI